MSGSGGDVSLPRPESVNADNITEISITKITNSIFWFSFCNGLHHPPALTNVNPNPISLLQIYQTLLTSTGLLFITTRYYHVLSLRKYN
ncbi:hypothetical protein ASPSYDRAFT_334527 [Aspergillus sydowii CBS 593.65]|uniref:Uncharacterized protein n=1 Tax=Aspergillus sydowii CBS 593.65 TaxID=1036612 RepID=A0A1L9TYT5_9EURO|nr:uncharacterized protein ASPSYDRAFT_334527 [Aspergillus sydowii CBS 593.65]OJJ64591.1 hypothetical protein ASPSYDRAFT_334527 [Aspergillus sydowii CBS 593.65]